MVANERLSAESLARLDSLIAKHNLSECRDEIIEAASECALLEMGGADDYARVGNSRYGGVPDLPQSWEWPLSNNDGERLIFLMQINLAEVPSFAGKQLPDTGLLYLFTDSAEEEPNPYLTFPTFLRVLYYGGDYSLLKRPEFNSNTEAPYNPYRLVIERSFDISDYAEPFYNYSQPLFYAGSDLYQKLQSRGQELDRYSIHELCHEAWGITATNGVYNKRLAGKLMGFTDEENGAFREIAYLLRSGNENKIVDAEWRRDNASLVRSGAAEWLLLWNVWENNNVGTDFGSPGYIEIFIHRDDLAVWNLDNLYGIQVSV